MLLTTKDAGKRLGLSPGAVYALIQRDVIPAERTDRGLTLIPEDALEGLALSYDEIADLVRQKKQKLLAQRATRSNDHGNDSRQR